MGCGASKSTETADGTQPKKEKKPKKKSEPLDSIEMKESKIPEIDSFFEKVAEPFKTMIDMRKALQDAVEGLTKLAKTAESPKEALRNCLKDLKEGLGDIGFKLEFSTEGVRFAGIDEETLPGEIKEIYDAFMNLFNGIKTIVTSCPKLVNDFKELVSEAKALKDNIVSAAKNAGLNPMGIAKAGKAVAVNIKTTCKAPLVCKDLLVQGKNTIKDLKDLAKALMGQDVPDDGPDEAEDDGDEKGDAEKGDAEKGEAENGEDKKAETENGGTENGEAEKGEATAES
ncbi:uncharacterized protein TRIADDRAFT_60725 [Trichoplax adhaerens]|uniref:Uncharacterized protein n=1 Tax=Trichoplax adhaerens TaxID=10228 RepID=B3S975_TRIAD|nr:predicted protein [Trichoplax adhaerens]EDV20820.1 predicted protein [Trichoplax adhaerens]|eukprot:XP_002116761.1 predicted protein [Trichoplax adhaerens]